jgi:hypothetical protein
MIRSNMPSNNNRERTNTGGSTGSWGGESGRLRERSNTDGSVRSVGSFGESADQELVSLATTPRRISTKPNKLNQRRKIVDWIQRQKLPQQLSRSSAAGAEGVPIITGLDRVIFGTQSAAEAVQIAGFNPPRYLWYMLSGAMCDVIQFTMDVMLHYSLHIQDASTCWAIGFFLSVFFRHTSHRYLVFGDYVGGYKNSLIRMYGGYSVIIVLSTIFNIVMTKMASISHYAAWILTLLWTGIANYFILKKIWSFGGPAAVATTAASNKQ